MATFIKIGAERLSRNVAYWTRDQVLEPILLNVDNIAHAVHFNAILVDEDKNLITDENKTPIRIPALAIYLFDESLHYMVEYVVKETLDEFHQLIKDALAETAAAASEDEAAVPTVTVRAGTSLDVLRTFKRLSGDELDFTRAELDEGVALPSVPQSQQASVTRIAQITNGLDVPVMLGTNRVRPGGTLQVYESDLTSQMPLKAGS